MSMRISRKPERGGTPPTMDLAATVNGQPYSVEYLVRGSLHFVWTATGSPVGTIKLQVSNNVFKNTVGTDSPNCWNASAYWEDVPGSQCDVTAGGGSHMWDLTETACEAVRIAYTRTSGTGTAEVFFLAKEF